MRSAIIVVTAVSVSAGAAVWSPIAAQTTGNSAQTGSSESLSTKLSKSGGVITPNKEIDPGIKVQAPDPHPNSTPVIPPAATGGGSAK